MTDSVLALAGDFPAADLAAWRAEADAALKGAPFDRLVRKTLDGVARGPLFTAEDRDGAGVFDASGAERDAFLPWGIRQPVAEPDPKAANAAILLADLSAERARSPSILTRWASTASRCVRSMS
jgi:methylmalonyl-CoA mutase